MIHLPIKRSPELAPLSRQHHEGLLLSWKIKRGVQLGIEPARMVAYCHWFWKHHLLPHIEAEETALLHLIKEEKLSEQFRAEHTRLKSSVTVLSDADSLLLFGDVLHHHIRFEERVLFRHIEVAVTKEELAEAGTFLAAFSGSTAVWEDAFWLPKTGNDV